MNLLVDNAFEGDDSGRVKFLPATDIGEVAQQIVEVRSEVVIYRKALLDQFLRTPLKVFKALRYTMDVNAQASEYGGSHQTAYQFRYLK